MICDEIACIEWKVEAKRIVSFVENFSPPEIIYNSKDNGAYLVVDERSILVDYEYGDVHYYYYYYLTSMNCSTHPTQPLMLFCTHCLTKLCLKCAPSHSGHTLSDFEDVCTTLIGPDL